MNKNKLSEKINKLKAGADFEKVGKSLGLNSLESEALEYSAMRLLNLADEQAGSMYNPHYNNHDYYRVSYEDFMDACKNIKVPYIVDNTDYQLDEEEQHFFHKDGYIIVNDMNDIDAETCDYVARYINHYQTYNIDFSKVIDFSTIEKYIHLLTVNKSVAGNQWKAMEKLAQKKNIDIFTAGMLLKWLDF